MGLDGIILGMKIMTTKIEGMGMGLSIARSIIEAHRGNIHAENNPDKGATVRFTIPTASV